MSGRGQRVCKGWEGRPALHCKDRTFPNAVTGPSPGAWRGFRTSKAQQLAFVPRGAGLGGGCPVPRAPRAPGAAPPLLCGISGVCALWYESVGSCVGPIALTQFPVYRNGNGVLAFRRWRAKGFVGALSFGTAGEAVHRPPGSAATSGTALRARGWRARLG